jgi:hypothetical protein
VRDDDRIMSKAASEFRSFFESLVLEHREKAILRSPVFATREERIARRTAVIELSIELGRIREHTLGATGLAEHAIECIMEGDWESAGEYAPDFLFQRERHGADSPETHAVDRRMAATYERFHATLVSVCAAAGKRASGKPTEDA